MRDGVIRRADLTYDVRRMYDAGAIISPDGELCTYSKTIIKVFEQHEEFTAEKFIKVMEHVLSLVRYLFSTNEHLLNIKVSQANLCFEIYGGNIEHLQKVVDYFYDVSENPKKVVNGRYCDWDADGVLRYETGAPVIL